MATPKALYPMECTKTTGQYLNTASEERAKSPLEKTRTRIIVTRSRIIVVEQLPKSMPNRSSERRRRRSPTDKTVIKSLKERRTKRKRTGRDSSTEGDNVTKGLKDTKKDPIISQEVESIATSSETPTSISLIPSAVIWEPPPKPEGFDDRRLLDEPTWEEICQPIPEHHKFIHVLNHFKAWNE